MEALLLIPSQAQWLAWLDEPHDAGCSGPGSCHVCLSEMYPRRQAYLNSYLRVFLANRAQIRAQEARMPRLLWFTANRPRTFMLEDFHWLHCDSAALYCWALKPLLPRELVLLIVHRARESRLRCQCDAALLLGQMVMSLALSAQSLDQIWPRYRKLRRQVVCK